MLFFDQHFHRHYLVRRLRQYQRPLLISVLLLFLLDCLTLIQGRPRTVRSPLGRAPFAQAIDNSSRIFIVSVHRNTEKILPAWSQAVLSLIDYLGPTNVYFSALESGSQDETKARLTDMQAKLAAQSVPHTIDLGMTVWEQVEEIETRPASNAPRQKDWIWDEAEAHWDLRRIPYLAKIRNRAMQPMFDMDKTHGTKYDKVLWINDVVFDTQDFVTLLNTRDGRYAAACSMDFKRYPVYYDTFALRDDQGQKTVSVRWPWFLSPTSRQSVRKSEPVKLDSCWNGMVLMDAAPFYDTVSPLRFRGISDSLADLHLEGSECCLIHADNPLSSRPDKGVWLNPNVRVGYSEAAYHDVQRGSGTMFPGALATVTGAWANRWLRWRAAIQLRLETATVQRRLKQWQADSPKGLPPRSEPGDYCLINEMQIMWQNGWKHL